MGNLVSDQYHLMAEQNVENLSDVLFIPLLWGH